jgi:predicted SprT family Zn-dependent metalloprotease
VHGGEVLERVFDEINREHFDGFLERPVLRWNSRLRRCAGRFCPGSRSVIGKIHREPVIELASYLLRVPESEKHIRDTMGHEMIHYWLWVRRRPCGHTAEFRARMRQMGVSRYASATIERPYRHLYGCGHCLKVFPTRKRLSGVLACSACCASHARGRFDARFKLIYLRELRPGEAPTAPTAFEARE